MITGGFWGDIGLVFGCVFLVLAAFIGLAFLIRGFWREILDFAKRPFRREYVSQIPVILWIGAIGVGFFWFRTHYASLDLVFRLAAAVVALILIAFNIRIVRMLDGVRSAALVEFLGTPVRSGSGFMLVFQPIGIPFESVTATVVLKEDTIDDKLEADTADEETIPIDYFVEFHRTASGMINALRFGENLKSTINQCVRSLISTEVRKIHADGVTGKTGRDIVHDTKDEIARKVQAEFMSKYAWRYGVELVFRIDDPVTPKELADAQLAIEVQEKQNKKRESDLAKIDALVAKRVADSKEQGTPITVREAHEGVQVDLKLVEKKLTKDQKTIEVGPVLAGAVKSLLPMVLKRGDCCHHEDPSKEPIGFKAKKEGA
jgi:hypothetical protein